MPNPEQEKGQDPEPTPVPPPPMDTGPSATGLVDGDPEELRPAPPATNQGE